MSQISYGNKQIAKNSLYMSINSIAHIPIYYRSRFKGAWC